MAPFHASVNDVQPPPMTEVERVLRALDERCRAAECSLASWQMDNTRASSGLALARSYIADALRGVCGE